MALPAQAPPAKPAKILKWAGSKVQLLPELLARMPEKLGRYHEPFFGSGALFFALTAARRLQDGAFLGDANERLIRTYLAVQMDVDEVLAQLAVYAARYAEHSQYFFDEMRRADPDAWPDTQVAAWMIFLNRTCFNGLYRVNAAGRFNVPHGRYKQPVICNEPAIRAAHAALAQLGGVLGHGDFRSVLRTARPGDTAYFDPPYAPVTPTANFTAFTPGGFTASDQRDLRDIARVLKARGVHVLISNSSAPVIDQLYGEGDFKIEKILARRAINSKGSGRGPGIEYLIS